MKRTLTVAGTATVLLFVISLMWSSPAANPAAAREGSGSEDAGKQVFMDQKCNMCHDVSTAGITATTKSAAMKGPDLVNTDKDADFLTKYLKLETDIDGKKHKKKAAGSDDDLKVLVDWLQAQKK